MCRFNVGYFLSYLGTAMIYPVFVLVTSGGQRVKFIDAMTIAGLVFLALGVIYSLVRHGDFDIAEYVTRRSASSMKHEKIQSFEAFKENKKEKRKDSFKYPFLTGILMLAASALLAVFSY